MLTIDTCWVYLTRTMRSRLEAAPDMRPAFASGDNRAMGFTSLETSRLSIRRFAVDDLADLVEYRRDPTVALYQDWGLEWSLVEAQRYLEHSDEPELGTPGEWTQFAVVDRISGRLCGDIGVHFIETQPSTVELGVTMSSEFQGIGLAAEAVRSVTSWLFSEFDLHRVFAHVDARNVPARALLCSLGYRQEAELQEADWFKGEWSTLCVYAILAKEWPHSANG
jgi:RimJ/RimL family protein N-acetyltransferase